jgi:RNA polymerase sigma factor (sigma-70 family)
MGLRSGRIQRTSLKPVFRHVLAKLQLLKGGRLSQRGVAIRLDGMVNGAYAVIESMDASADIFTEHRPRLFGIAYRMLGSRADAEDILQETYLRWIELKPAELRSTEAWLATVVTRLCIDRLRSAKTEREAYTGPWLPEPLVSPGPFSPDRTVELASDISIAFLTVLERLAPEERAAFLLHEVFDFDYSEISQIIGKNQAACRASNDRSSGERSGRNLSGQFCERRTSRQDASQEQGLFVRQRTNRRHGKGD